MALPRGRGERRGPTWALGFELTVFVDNNQQEGVGFSQNCSLLEARDRAASPPQRAGLRPRLLREDLEAASAGSDVSVLSTCHLSRREPGTRGAPVPRWRVSAYLSFAFRWECCLRPGWSTHYLRSASAFHFRDTHRHVTKLLSGRHAPPWSVPLSCPRARLAPAWRWGPRSPFSDN